jgi:hypothetical protein
MAGAQHPDRGCQGKVRFPSRAAARLRAAQIRVVEPGPPLDPYPHGDHWHLRSRRHNDQGHQPGAELLSGGRYTSGPPWSTTIAASLTVQLPPEETTNDPTRTDRARPG